MSQPPYQPDFQPPYQLMTCYRHPQVETAIRCQRCGRPICPACMIPAAVGFQCPDCVAQGTRETRQNQGPYGGERSLNPNLTTIVLIALNAVVFGAGFLMNQIYDLLEMTPYGRCMSLDGQGWYPGAGPLDCPAVGEWAPGVATGAFWQPLTSAFTHAEITHIGFNMLALWFLGPQLERVLGRVRFLAVYLLSALGGSALVMWLAEPTDSVLGASGGIFGLIGALLILVLKLRGDLRSVLIWLGLNLAFTFIFPGISWQGHIGGLLAGAAATAIIIFAPKQNRGPVQAVGLCALTVLIIGLIAARAFLLG